MFRSVVGHAECIAAREAVRRCQHELGDVKPAAGIVLAATRPDHDRMLREIGAAQGDIIVIGTGGIWETRDVQSRLFGKERFMDVIRRECEKTEEKIVDACFRAVTKFRDGLPIEDDITLAVIKKT